MAVFPSGDGLLIHCALHAWVRIPSSSGRALKGLCCLSQTSIRGHFRDYITSVHYIPFLDEGLYFSLALASTLYVRRVCLRRCTANPLCSTRVGSNPILVVKGPQGTTCVVFLKRAYEAILGTTSPVSSSLPSIPSLSG